MELDYPNGKTNNKNKSKHNLVDNSYINNYNREYFKSITFKIKLDMANSLFDVWRELVKVA